MLRQTQRRRKYEPAAERFANAPAIYYAYIISRLLVFSTSSQKLYVMFWLAHRPR